MQKISNFGSFETKTVFLHTFKADQSSSVMQRMYESKSEFVRKEL